MLANFPANLCNSDSGDTGIFVAEAPTKICVILHLNSNCSFPDAKMD